MGIKLLIRTPSKVLVEELIFKRGHCKIEDKRHVLDNNEIVEKNLGNQGIICLEDIVYELMTTGKAFQAVNEFIWLNNMIKAFQIKQCRLIETKI